MASFGANSQNNYEISIPNLRKMALEINTDHLLVQTLCLFGVYEARILPSIIDETRKVTEV